MANLVSPGVAVSVIDESAYGAGSQGTVPLIILATKSNKGNVSGSGYAEGTIPANANKPYLLTSQRELVEKFGVPEFTVVDGTPIHGSEVNEYGLLAAYSFLGLANRAYVLRGDIDLAQLESSIDEPAGEPANGTYWLDLTNTVWGLKEWDGSKWAAQEINIPAQADVGMDQVPFASYGTDGQYAIVLYSGTQGLPLNTLFKKINGAWYEVNTTLNIGVYVEPHYKLGTNVPSAGNLGDVWVQTTSPNNGLKIVVKKYNKTNRIC
jgi:hypothetical protein